MRSRDVAWRRGGYSPPPQEIRKELASGAPAPTASLVVVGIVAVVTMMVVVRAYEAAE